MRGGKSLPHPPPLHNIQPQPEYLLFLVRHTEYGTAVQSVHKQGCVMAFPHVSLPEITTTASDKAIALFPGVESSKAHP